MKAMVIDYASHSISISSAFKKKALIPGTPEYAQLIAVRNDFPDFHLVTREFKANTKQDRYRGLSYNFMRDYIKKVEGDDAKIVGDALEDLIDISKCHSTGRRYATVKSWFLKRYPDVATFGMNEKELAKWNEKQEQENARATDNITDFSSAKEGASPKKEEAKEEKPA